MQADRNVDVVIVGSGFAGSVSANRLATAGFKVLVLERGPWRESLPVRAMGISTGEPFPYGRKGLTHLARSIQFNGRKVTLNKSGLMEHLIYPGLSILVSSSVGGGSHVWCGLLEEPLDLDYWRDRHPELDPSCIESYYDKIRKDLGAVRLSREAGLPNSIWNYLPDAADARCRPASPQPYIAIKFSQADSHTRPELDGVSRRQCEFDGDGVLGSRGGAKASTDFIYLAPVLNAGATVRDMCEVNRIATDHAAEPEYTVHYRDLRSCTSAEVKTKCVVLAAGTMGTLRLLFASSFPQGALTPMPALGRNFGGNCDVAAAWLRGESHPSIFHSPVILGRFRVDQRDTPFLAMWAVPGVETLPLTPWVRRRLAEIVPLLGTSADLGSGCVTFQKGRLMVDYDAKREPGFAEVREALRVLEIESGHKVWHLKRPLTVHPWGGACLGRDVNAGVVDHNGEVYGNKGLFVADAAALPATVGSPPALTIAAWAHHVAERIAQKLA